MKYRPEVTAIEGDLPVALADVKDFLNVDHADDDAEITAAIEGARDYYEGWSGILGIVLLEKHVTQRFDGFGCLSLPLGPVQAVGMSVKWTDEAGTETTVGPENYALRVDGAGRATVKLRQGYSAPSLPVSEGAVTVTYKAGWPLEKIPQDLQTAIKLRVQMLYDEAAKANAETLERIETTLINKYRRWLV